MESYQVVMLMLIYDSKYQRKKDKQFNKTDEGKKQLGIMLKLSKNYSSSGIIHCLCKSVRE